MGAREVVVLGTASQVPTRTRAHQATLLRWDREVVLFDPGEGTQRQLTLAGVAAGSITRICLTHPHGDHCLGLPGVLQRMALDGSQRPVDLSPPPGSRTSTGSGTPAPPPPARSSASTRSTPTGWSTPGPTWC